MKKFTIIALVTLFVTNFTLFLGWIPIGVLIPQAIFLLLFFVFRPDVFVSKTMIFYYIFFLYEMTIRAVYGVGYDWVVVVARFLVMAVPLLISTALFSSKGIKDCKGVSKYVLIVSFVTLLLSIRVLQIDGNALRLASFANSTGDMAELYKYWQQGMAEYGMAAMMAFMPAVLVYCFKSSQQKKVRFFSIVGIIVVLYFMFLGQVTTTLILCVMVSLISCLNFNNKALTIIGVALMAIFVFTQFSGIMNFAISLSGDSAMGGNFTSIAGVASGEELDDATDAGIRVGLLFQTINAFISNPLFGNPAIENGQHNYFLDWLATVGIIGCLPFFMLIWNQFKIVSSYLSNEAKKYYQIILWFFILLGLIKNMSGPEYWDYLFIYYPAILVWIDSTKKKNSLIQNKDYANSL